MPATDEDPVPPPPDCPAQFSTLAWRGVGVIVRTDDAALREDIDRRVRAAGFEDIRHQDLGGAAEPRLAVRPGSLLRHTGGTMAYLGLAALAEGLFREGGVDLTLYPLTLADVQAPADEEPEAPAEIDVPILAIRSGLIPPWAEAAPEAWLVRVEDDDPAIAGEHLEAALIAARFARTRRRKLEDLGQGFSLTHPPATPRVLVETARRVVAGAMAAAGVSGFDLSVRKGEAHKRPEIRVTFPAAAARSGRLRAVLCSPARYSLTVIGPAPAATVVADAERGRGWGSISVQVDDDAARGSIRFGGAERFFIDHLQAELQSAYGVSFAPEKAWSDADMDVWVRVPDSLKIPVAAPTVGVPAPAIARRTARPSRGPFVRISEDELHVGPLVVPRRKEAHPLVPAQAEFVDDMVIDQPTADTLLFLAEGLLSGSQPLALEGPTSASKTYLSRFLGAAIGAPVWRLNLTATSEAADMIGRYSPRTDGPGFRWIDGAAPAALEAGGLLLFDELNLAPSETLERLNGILESRPYLALSEGDGRHVVARPGFRVIASYNLDYAGRQDLSPALRNRFRTRLVGAATEQDYAALGRRLIVGTQPRIVVDDVCYGGETGLTPPLARLRTSVREIERLIRGLARLQVALEKGFAGGATERDYVFTRRDFIAVLAMLDRKLPPTADGRAGRGEAVAALWRSLRHVCLERMTDADRQVAIDLAAAHGITATRWDLP